MFRCLFALIMSCSLCACAINPREASLLQQGQRDYENGFYKKAQQNLLPIACDGNATAQYAIGYMYYYGYGVALDRETGRFWIERAASKKYQPALQALKNMN